MPFPAVPGAAVGLKLAQLAFVLLADIVVRRTEQIHLLGRSMPAHSTHP
jgi:hypothetical protein